MSEINPHDLQLPLFVSPDEERTTPAEETGQFNHFMAEATEAGAYPQDEDVIYPASPRPHATRPSGKSMAHGPTGQEVSDKLAAEEDTPRTPEQILKNSQHAEDTRLMLRRAQAVSSYDKLQDWVEDIENPERRYHELVARSTTAAYREKQRQEELAQTRARVEALQQEQAS